MKITNHSLIPCCDTFDSVTGQDIMATYIKGTVYFFSHVCMTGTYRYGVEVSMDPLRSGFLSIHGIMCVLMQNRKKTEFYNSPGLGSEQRPKVQLILINVSYAIKLT